MPCESMRVFAPRLPCRHSSVARMGHSRARASRGGCTKANLRHCARGGRRTAAPNACRRRIRVACPVMVRVRLTKRCLLAWLTAAVVAPRRAYPGTGPVRLFPSGSDGALACPGTSLARSLASNGSVWIPRAPYKVILPKTFTSELCTFLNIEHFDGDWLPAKLCLAPDQEVAGISVPI